MRFHGSIHPGAGPGEFTVGLGYRGRQGADVAMLIRRVRESLNAPDVQCVGTSATLAGDGSFREQQREVATVASQLFGVNVRPEHVIGETLRRVTPACDTHDPTFLQALSARVANCGHRTPEQYPDLINDPLSMWIETTFGVQPEPGGQRIVRARPRSIAGPRGAAAELSELTGMPAERCAEAIRDALQAKYRTEEPPGEKALFAFRLHQFIRRGDTVYASVETEGRRHLTLQGQQYVPGDRQRVLLPLVFCRECGQEYYCVRQTTEQGTGRVYYAPRDLSDRINEDDNIAGFLYVSQANPWPSHDQDAMLERLPDDWVEEHRGGFRVKRSRQDALPFPVRVNLQGEQAAEGVDGHFLSAPFRFCLHCGVAYAARQTSDFGKLTALGSEGRSTATTILSLSAVRHPRATDLPTQAHKLLSFTDNRQDASLQAGHFNDFVEVGVLRGALYAAAQAAGPAGLQHDELTHRVFDQLGLHESTKKTFAAIRTPVSRRWPTPNGPSATCWDIACTVI